MDMHAIDTAIQYLTRGKTILCPTDTIWGLSADATNPAAVEAVFALKNRPKEKRFVVLVSSVAMLAKYIETIPKDIERILQSCENATTIIYPAAKDLAPNAIAEDGSIAIRIVDEGVCHQLIEKFDKPIISTSANFSGEETPLLFKDVSNEIKEGVDFCMPFSEVTIENTRPSTILKITERGLQVIRA